MGEKKDKYGERTRVKLSYYLNNYIFRHAAKEGMNGPLSMDGAVKAHQLFSQALELFPLVARNPNKHGGDLRLGVDFSWTPMMRGEQTADVAIDQYRSTSLASVRVCGSDRRLSEGEIADHPELIKGPEKAERWVKDFLETEGKGWPQGVKTGKEAASGLANLVMERIRFCQETSSYYNWIDIANGLTVIAYLYWLGKLWEKEIIKIELSDTASLNRTIPYLGHVRLRNHYQRKQILWIDYRGHRYDTPVGLTQVMADGRF